MLNKRKKFIPKKYLNNQINERNCYHELLVTSCFDEIDNNQNYKCLICNKDIVINNNEDIKDKYVYYDLYDNIDINFLKKLLKYISLKSIKSRGMNIAKVFKELEPLFEKISSTLNDKIKDAEVLNKKCINKKRNKVKDK